VRHAYRTDVDVGPGFVGVILGAAEHLCLGLKLGMDFESYGGQVRALLVHRKSLA